MSFKSRMATCLRSQPPVPWHNYLQHSVYVSKVSQLGNYIILLKSNIWQWKGKDCREGGRTLCLHNGFPYSICLGVSTQPLSYSFTHSVIQQYFNSYYAPALYTLWGKYKKWSLTPGQRGRQTDVDIRKYNRYNSKSEWHWEPEKRVIFPQI